MTHTRYAEIDPRLIQASPWNSNVVSHENEEKLKASIERHGMFKPVLVREMEDGSFQSLGGFHRAEQAVELGMATVPAFIISGINDQQAKEISLADNARYGVDDTLKLSEIIADLDAGVLEDILPWTARDMESIAASLAVNVDDLDLDDAGVLPDEDEEDEEEEKPERQPQTHQIIRFRCSVDDAAKISGIITGVMKREGFTTEDALSNAGNALAFLLLNGSDDV